MLHRTTREKRPQARAPIGSNRKENPMPGDFVGRGVVRKLWAADAAAYAAHLKRLDANARSMRFQGLVSDAYLVEHAGRAIAARTVVYGYFDEGVLRAVAELHPEPGRTEAEAAFSVEADYQEHGVGTELFRRLVTAARNRGVRRLMMNCLPGNLAMRRLCARFGAKITIADGEAVGVIATDGPTPLSFFVEAVADGTGLAKALLDLELERLRAA